jgi:diaminopimelate epimerase
MLSGAGNDFVVLEAEDAARLDRRAADWVSRLCRRRVSVGADGVLVVARSGPDRVRVEFRNPDGSAAFCGNGSRCAARFARVRGLAGASMILETAAGEVPAEVGAENVRLTLPVPLDEGDATIEAGGTTLVGRRISAGVPHFVVENANPGGAPLEAWGPEVRRHPAFGAAGTNFDLVGRTADGTLAIRTWERGVEGETLACGSGALAAALRFRAARSPGETLKILPASGIPLSVTFPGPPERPEAAILEGDARIVFEGELGSDALNGEARPATRSRASCGWPPIRPPR